MEQTPDALADELARIGADPKLGVEALVGTLRAAGVSLRSVQLREGARVFRSRSPWVGPDHLTRQGTADALGLSLQRVDQLRRDGVLSWERDPHTGVVRVTRRSVDALLARRGESAGDGGEDG